MSEWNNSYAYQNQYQGSNTWNNDMNGQYSDQGYYQGTQFGPGNQYVSFDQFISQIQGNNAASSSGANYNNAQYQNYADSQYSYNNLPSTSQNTHNSYNYAQNPPVVNKAATYQAQSQFKSPAPDPSTLNEVVLKSNLTATATEFVPKGTAVNPSNSNIKPESSKSRYSMKDSKSGHSSSSNTNWRDRAYTSEQSEQSSSRDVYRNNDRYENNRQDSNDQREPDTRSKESYRNSRNFDRNHDRNYESSNHSDHYETRNQESNGRSNDSRSDRGSKGHKNKNNKDAERTYYNSAVNQFEKSGRDVSNRSRYSGSSRLRGIERNVNEDEQYANSYLQYREEKNERNTKERNERSHKERNTKDRPERSNIGRNEHSSKNRYEWNNIDRDERSNVGRMERSNIERNEKRQKDRNERKNTERNERDNIEMNEQRNTEQNESSNIERNERSNIERNEQNHIERKERKNIERNERSNTGRNARSNPERNEYSNIEKNEHSNMGRNESRNIERNERRNIERDERSNKEKNEQSNVERNERTYKDKSERVREKENVPSPRNRQKERLRHAEKENKELTQRERLSEQLDKGTLECLVCCERVKQVDQVWSCANCYHVLHLRCIRKWATSSTVEGKWRCPACQNTNEEIPLDYRCLCGWMRSPPWSRGPGAHTCGEACRRARRPPCPHPCPLACHPGPCPPCTTNVTKQCGCGAETRTVMCSDKSPLLCGRTCGRTLECGVHTCDKPCHEGPCDACTHTIVQVCYCAAEKERTVPCTAETRKTTSWSCGAPCSHILGCGAHSCSAPCHPPPCAPCALRPANCPLCPCGSTQLEPGVRTKCTEPIPTCDNICAKPLPCGPSGDKHFCKITCHQGDCPPCPDKTVVQCRCGHSARDVPCRDLPHPPNNILCQKKCNKKLSCGRHRCRTICCSDTAHRCALVCGRSLTCQLHRCEDFCHTGHCSPCPRLSFEELTCECGAEVIFPPIRCGTKPPPCNAECTRTRPCGHPPHHSCHGGECPPCVVLTAKRCHGGHEERKTIPCSQEEFSCGLPCGKPLPCGKHTCVKTCHKGPCDTAKCMQPCNEKRPSCGHPCSAPCHAANGGPCPSSAPCRRPVRAQCPCGRRTQERPCADNMRDLHKMMSALAASKVQEGGTVDISELRPSTMLKTLECDDECRIEARNRQLALALQIRNPDVSSKLAPRYSEHVRATAAKEPAFAQQIHDKLTELVHTAKKSKQKTRSHSFPSMNWAKRQFIHELCEQFGCESVAYDAEPNRNVVATADKEKSWLPAMSVLEVLAREAGKRKVPGPVLRAGTANTSTGTSHTTTGTGNKSTSGWATLTSTNAWASRAQRTATSTASTTSTASAPATATATATAPATAPASATPKIDYFDNPPE